MKKIGYKDSFDIEIINSTNVEKRKKYTKNLFKKLQREQGLLERDCDRIIRNDRVVWASSMVATGDADGAVTGNTRRFGASLEKIKQVVDVREGEIMFGLNMVVHKGKTIFVGDTSVHEYPTSEQMAEIAISTARVVKLFGFEIAISAICSEVGYS
jgi:malate dehydrogenase (oxaloacetate-decarboxylating)(NADP+)